MPKLAPKLRKQVENAEAVTGGFEPLPPGKYIATLSKDVEERKSQAGNLYWNVEFTDITDLEGNRKPGRQWYTLMVPKDPSEKPDGLDPEKSEKWDTAQRLAAGRIKAFFEAFGYTTNSDTEELVGERVILQIGVETAQQGSRAGEKVNRVNGVYPLDDDLVDAIADADGDDF